MFLSFGVNDTRLTDKLDLVASLLQQLGHLNAADVIRGIEVAGFPIDHKKSRGLVR